MTHDPRKWKRRSPEVKERKRERDRKRQAKFVQVMQVIALVKALIEEA